MKRRNLLKAIMGIGALSGTAIAKNKTVGPVRNPGPLVGYGTRVILKENGSAVIVPPQVGYKLKPGEKELKYVRDIHVHYKLNEVVTADIQVLPVQDIIHYAMPKIDLYDPIQGKQKKVCKIVFEDGSESPVWDD